MFERKKVVLSRTRILPLNAALAVIELLLDKRVVWNDVTVTVLSKKQELDNGGVWHIAHVQGNITPFGEGNNTRAEATIHLRDDRGLMVIDTSHLSEVYVECLGYHHVRWFSRWRFEMKPHVSFVIDPWTRNDGTKVVHDTVASDF